MPEPLTSFGDGEFRVGIGIATGRYRAIAPSEDCRWTVIRFFREFRGVVAIVDIDSDDTTFFSYGCGTWSKDLTPAIEPGQPFVDGTFVVGPEVAPGRYRTTTAARGCKWARLRTFRPTESVIWVKSPIVDIAPSDAGFTSRGCGSWSSDLTPILDPGRPFGDGVFIVGVDIEPGRYRASSYTDDCVWDRLSSFDRLRGTEGVAKGHVPIVNIGPPDAGFHSRGCGSWAPWSPTSFEDGEHRVGVDVQPGRYRATAPSKDCRWSIDTTASGRGMGTIGGGLPVTILDVSPLDKTVVSEGCGSWSEDLTPIVRPGQPFGDGTWLVGPEIAAGRYRATKPSGSCHWFRLSNFRVASGRYGSSEFWNYLGGWGRTVTGGDTNSIVEIESADTGFYSAGCGTWANELTPIVMPGQPFVDGTYVIGDEIAPGRYRAREPSAGCYWERLSDFSGEYRDNGYRFIVRRTGNSFIVDIAPEDAGFYSVGCGTWSDDPSPVTAPGQPFLDGTYLVGVDIAPGRYRATAPTEDCRWHQVADFGGIFGAYEGLHTISSGILLVVDIGPASVGFISHGCGTWSADLAPALAPGQPFVDGTYIVGIDVEPGRYRATTPSDSCRWARLSGFFGDTSHGYEVSPDLVAYGDEHPAIVDVAPSDVGFHSEGCGTWSNDLKPIVGISEPLGDGTYIVAVDVEPGRYRATLWTGVTCRWSRLSGFSGKTVYEGTDDVITSGRSTVVTIEPTDAGFYTHGCGTWTDDLTPVVTLGQPFGDGTYIVGIDIEPGRYRATSPNGQCKWTRLRGFAGGTSLSEDVITYGSSAVVTIAATDAGFVSRGCGAWTPDPP